MSFAARVGGRLAAAVKPASFQKVPGRFQQSRKARPISMAENHHDDLQSRVDYQFRNPKFLLEALTHASYAQESQSRLRDNEQMEFLGDAVLTFVVSVLLADAFPEWEEGKLTRARAHLVAAPHLHKVARRMNLGQYLRLGRGEEKTGGRDKPALMVNALEALIAAIYRDGGLEAAREFIARFIVPKNLGAAEADMFPADFKSALQETLQAAKFAPADYRVVEEFGPEHQKIFTVEALAGENLMARGRGGNKKAAEQEAARQILEMLAKKTETHG
jgi:ribonuclease-3